ncbi:hypothetical protein H4219_001934 [Mycoemilia scoparia]|uniref:ER membrane protein complex subunit 4 n=1 Tax=Mycoemilia scoparia TaxID=417184 RepID=A0A9W7ZYV0_9FUNG|nr:hypothetical protein H4219_001934 [Mycoemilia scoparia]
MPYSRAICDTKLLVQARAKESGSLKIDSPHGFSATALGDSVSRNEASTDESESYLRVKARKYFSTDLRMASSMGLKAWDLALQPAKTLPMQIFMAWMSGTSVQIFSIIVTAMVLFSPIKAIIGVNEGKFA